MIRVELKGDMQVALRAASTLSDSVQGRAVARALNRTATTVRAEARKSIRARYMIPASRVNKVLKIRNATPGQLEAIVYAVDSRIPLGDFVARTRKGQLVTVRVLRGGARKTVTGNPSLAGTPFVQTMKTGHVGIFQRVTKSRLPIRELFTVAIPKALVSRVIGQQLQKVASQRFGAELSREVKFRLGKGGA